MTEIDELQGRLTRALDRIAQGVTQLSAPLPVSEEDLPAEPAADGVSAAEIARLTELLDEEKIANSQLEERNRALNARLSETPAPAPAPAPADAALQEQFAAQRESLAELDSELQRLRLSNEMLRKSCEDMRVALQDGLGEPHLINQAMLAELESLRSARAVEQAELRAVLGAIEPVLSESSGLAAQQETVQ
ncbi:hypothetical protein Q4543_08325 [Salipiger sp. 1_MG-2023]|uniref:hypothetical protein n=1 Tax=Salipiger sp. 1_MG-2023 TaxID=3062665 RepID=UPI0026E13510|nr:hypothetical protein [Salipiger sp. 1_MG-2023]MDO6585523.1 hypothetical protein [Salipiger sp. 1_MG-2023]